jgi:hypothetical protein
MESRIDAQTTLIFDGISQSAHRLILSPWTMGSAGFQFMKLFPYPALQYP